MLGTCRKAGKQHQRKQTTNHIRGIYRKVTTEGDKQLVNSAYRVIEQN